MNGCVLEHSRSVVYVDVILLGSVCRVSDYWLISCDKFSTFHSLGFVLVCIGCQQLQIVCFEVLFCCCLGFVIIVSV